MIVSNFLCKKRALLKPLAICLLATASTISLNFTGAVAQENRTITFDDVFANPDDTQLNLDYARQEARAGNLLAAAATLERLLLLDENWDEARLFYAVVLYRLGDFSAAENEIGRLEGRKLSPALIAQLDSLRARVRGKKKKSSLSGSLALGVSYDDNVAVNLNDEAAGTSTADYSMTARIRAKYTRDLGSEETRLFANVSTFSKFYEDLDQVNFNFAAAAAGIEGERGAYQWRTGVTIRGLEIDGQHYLTETGLEASVTREINSKNKVSINLTASDQEYNDILLGGALTNREAQRSGNKYSAIVSLNHKFSGQLRGSIGLGYQIKESEYAPYENDSFIARFNLGRTFANGSYARASYFYRKVEFSEADTDVLTPDELLQGSPREEDRHYLRFALGTPLSTFFSNDSAEFQQILDTVRIEGSVFYDMRDANFDIYDYDNTGAEVRLIWQFNK